MKIIIDAGHGGKDPGAIDGFEREMDDEIYDDEIYTKESELVLKAAKRLAEKLEEHEIIMTREDEEFVSLRDRVRMANEEKVDIFVSLHANSFSDPNANGIETLHFPSSREGLELAELVQRKMMSKVEAKNRGVKPRPRLYVLRRTKMPAILVELGFISNPEEEKKLNDEVYLEFLLDGIVEGVEEYARE